MSPIKFSVLAVLFFLSYANEVIATSTDDNIEQKVKKVVSNLEKNYQDLNDIDTTGENSFSLSLQYFKTGELTDTQYSQVNKLVTGAAVNNLPEDQYLLGSFYLSGMSPINKKDYGRAAKWFLESAKKGYIPAMSMLGAMLKDGKYFKKSEQEANMLFNYAASQKDYYALVELGLFNDEE